MALYNNRGFSIEACRGDNEFNLHALRETFPTLTFEIYGRNEHVGKVERSIRTIRDRSRGICLDQPYKMYPKIMIHGLITNVNYWLNQFPNKNSASTTVSPAGIVLGRNKPDLSKKLISFGSYAIVHVQSSSGMKARSIPAIGLYPSNVAGGSYFMSLLTGKRIHAYEWDELPVSDEVVAAVEKFAKDEGASILTDGCPPFEWKPGIPISVAVDHDDENMLDESSYDNEYTDPEIYDSNDEHTDTDIYDNNGVMSNIEHRYDNEYNDDNDDSVSEVEDVVRENMDDPIMNNDDQLDQPIVSEDESNDNDLEIYSNPPDLLCEHRSEVTEVADDTEAADDKKEDEDEMLATQDDDDRSEDEIQKTNKTQRPHRNRRTPTWLQGYQYTMNTERQILKNVQKQLNNRTTNGK